MEDIYMIIYLTPVIETIDESIYNYLRDPIGHYKLGWKHKSIKIRVNPPIEKMESHI
jgi:hypothetical protein